LSLADIVAGWEENQALTGCEKMWCTGCGVSIMVRSKKSWTEKWKSKESSRWNVHGMK